MRRSAAALVLALLLPLPGLAGEVVVKPGETLSEIAERYGVSVQRLMQLNGLKDAKDLWAGSRIQVPGAGSASPGRTGGSSGAGNYTVKPGETLSEIAERYGVSVQRLMQLNGLKDAKDLWAGSRIQVPGTASTARPTAAKPVVNRNAKEHKVMPGETLSEIADLYGVPMERLASLNGLAKPNALMAGTTLKLRTASAPKPAVKPATSKPVAAKPVAAKPVAAKPVAAKPAVKPAAQPTVQPVVQPVAAKPVVQPTPQPQPKPVAVAPKPAPATPVAAKPSTPDWRSYGPLQVDWANWQPMGGSFVAPSLNSDGQPLYLAINCSARRLNATGQSGTWKSWDAPQSDFEEQLITDLCKAKQS
jgi:LysM repeat protein